MGILPDVVAIVLVVVLGLNLMEWAENRNRRTAAVWPPPDADLSLIGEELGYLAGGDVRAVEAAIGRLRVAGAVKYQALTDSSAGSPTFSLAATGQPVPDPTALSTAVLAAVTDGTPFADLAEHPRVRAAIDDLKAGLGDGWSREDEMLPRRAFLVSSLPMIAVGVAGVAWATVPPLRWFTDVPLAVIGLLVVIGGVRMVGPPDSVPTPAQRAVGRAWERNGHLAPAMNPALLTYGPAAAALAVAMYGMTVLASVDPDLAGTTLYVSPWEDDGFVAGCGDFETYGVPSRGSGSGVEVGGEIDVGCGCDAGDV
jgi:uncharacterized protein (TIGR04222 family)